STFFFYRHVLYSVCYSFPTRRSSDLNANTSSFPDLPSFKALIRLLWPLITLCKSLLADSNCEIAFEVSIPSDFLSSFKISIIERSEEHTSELQSRFDIVCRFLL